MTLYFHSLATRSDPSQVCNESWRWVMRLMLFKSIIMLSFGGTKGLIQELFLKLIKGGSEKEIHNSHLLFSISM